MASLPLSRDGWNCSPHQGSDCVSHTPATSFWICFPNIQSFAPNSQEMSICSEHTIKNKSKPEEGMTRQGPRESLSSQPQQRGLSSGSTPSLVHSANADPAPAASQALCGLAPVGDTVLTPATFLRQARTGLGQVVGSRLRKRGPLPFRSWV